MSRVAPGSHVGGGRGDGQVFSKFLALGVGNYGAMGVSLAINAMLTRRLGVEPFGRLALLLTASQVLSLLTATWTQTGLVRFGAREYAATGSVSEAFWTRACIVAPWAFIALVATFLARARVAAYLGIPVWGLLVLSGHFFASFMLSSVGSIFQVRGDMRRYGTTLLLDKVVMAVLVAFLSWLRVLTPLTALGSYAASSSVVTAWATATLGWRRLTPVAFRRQAYKDMVSFSLPLILSSWVGLFGTTWFDYMVIRWYRPFSEIGLYSLGTVLAGVVQQVTIIFSTLLLPHLSVMVAKGELDDIRILVGRLFPYWLLATAVVFSLVVIGASAVVPLVFGHAFERSTAVLAMLMLATCALALFNAFTPLVVAWGSTWALTGICLVSGVVNVVMDLVLVPSYGILGAAGSTVLTYATSALLVLLFVQSRLGIRLFGLGLLSVPVLVVYLCFLSFDGGRFYLSASVSGVLSVYWLVRRFELFHGKDARLLSELGLGATFAPVVALLGGRSGERGTG